MVEKQYLYVGVVSPERGLQDRQRPFSALVGRGAVAVLVACAVLGLSGCSTLSEPTPAAPPVLPVSVEPLTEYVARAQAAEVMEGGRERARLIYRDAAKAYPTDKRPWLRLAQSYFDAADYGNAILSAQEVVQRDATDSVAQGLLAVSGLRITTVALSALRTQSNLSSSTRTEAEAMAANLRSLLGESVLVPKAADTAPKPQPKSAIRPKPKTQVAPAPAPVAPAAANPFGALK